MKRAANGVFCRPLFLLLTVSLFVSIPRTGETAPTLPRFLALDIQFGSGIDRSLQETLSNRFRRELFVTGRLQVIEKDEMSQPLLNQGVDPTACDSRDCALRAGQVMNAVFVATAQLEKVVNLYTFTVRVYEVATGQLAAVETIDCSCPFETVFTDKTKEMAGRISRVVLEQSAPVAVQPTPAPVTTPPVRTTTAPATSQKSQAPAPEPYDRVKHARIGIGLQGGYQGTTLPILGWKEVDGFYPYPAYNNQYLEGWNGGVRLTLYLTPSFAITEILAYNFYAVHDQEVGGRQSWDFQETYRARTKLEDLSIDLHAHFYLNPNFYFLLGGGLSMFSQKSEVSVATDTGIWDRLPNEFPYPNADWEPVWARTGSNRYGATVGLGLEFEKGLGFEVRYVYRSEGELENEVYPLAVGEPSHQLIVANVFLHLFLL